MSLDSALDKIAPVAAPGPVRPVARRPDAAASGKPSFAQLLKGHGQAAGRADETEPDAALAAAGRKRAADDDDAVSDEARSDETRQAEGGPADERSAGKNQPGAEDLPPMPGAPSTLQLAAASREEGSRSALAMLKDAAGHARGLARQAARIDAQELAARGGPDAAGDPRLLHAAAAFSMDALAGADAAASAAASAAAGSPLAPQVDQSLSPSDGSLPSLGAIALPGTPPAADRAAEAQAPAPASAELPVPPDSPAFPAALGVQLSTWLRDGVEHANLELHPRDLGPIEVRIAVRDGATQIELGAEVATTRAALVEAMPLLAEQLGQVGLSLSGGSVYDQSGERPGQSDGAAERGAERSAAGTGRADGRGASQAGALPDAPRSAVVRRGLLDLYA